MIEHEKSLKVVYVHDVDHDNQVAAMQNAGINAPCQLYSFTDTFPRHNPYNEELVEHAANADVVMIQKSLLPKRAGAAHQAIQALIRNPKQERHTYYLNDDFADPDSISAAVGIAMMEGMA